MIEIIFLVLLLIVVLACTTELANVFPVGSTVFWLAVIGWMLL